MRVLSLVFLLIGLAASGCATTLSSHQTAKPVAPGHVQIGAGLGAYTPLGAVGAVIGAGAKQTQRAIDAARKGESYSLSADDQQELLTAGIALAVMPPSVSYEMSIRTGLVDNVDVGFRYSVNAVRLDTKLRFFHQDLDGPEVPEGNGRSFDVALGVAGSKYIFDNPVLSVLEFVQLGNFERWDLEVPLYISWELGEIARFYGGPKYLYSHTAFDERLVNTAEQAGNVSGLDLSLPTVVHTHFIGATVGMMVGYKYVFLILELTGGYTICSPVVLGQKRNLGGLTLYPSIGLALRF